MLEEPRELLLCVAGAFLRTSAGAFSVGDRIEVAGVRGDVIDLGALTTTVLEVGPGHSYRTGRAAVSALAGGKGRGGR